MESNALAFSKLPAEVQRRLKELQTPDDGRYVFLARPSVLNYVAIAAAIGWVPYMFVATADYLWEYWMFWIFAAITLIVVPIALWAAWNVISAFTAKVRRGYVFTQDECISYAGDRIGFRTLSDLEGFQLLEHIKTIEIWIGDKVEKIKAQDFEDAEALDSVFVDWRNKSRPSFLAQYAGNATAFDPGPARAKTAALIMVFVLVSIGLSYAAKRMNRSFDDDMAWKRTENSQSVADFAAYKERHTNGNHAAEANARIKAIIDKAKSDYGAGVKSAANPEAVSALSAFFDSAASGAERKIYVKYSEDRQLDDAVVKKLKADTGLSISSYDFTIPTTALQYRKDKVLNDISVAFLPALRSSSVEFVLADELPADASVIEVKNVISSIEVYYFYNWYSANGEVTRYYNPGAKFDFTFEFRPRGANPYRSQFVSTLTNRLSTGAVDTRDLSNYSFDKVFFGSVSEDFAKYLQRDFGFAD